MKRKILFLLAIALSLPAFRVAAQSDVDNQISIQNTEIRRENGFVTINTQLDLKNIDLKTQEMLYLFPVMMTPDSLYSRQFDPIVVIGATRNKAIERKELLDDFQLPDNPQIVLKYRDRDKQLYPLALTMEYQEWLHNAQLVFYEDVTGCLCRNKANNKLVALNSILPPNPQFNLSYIEPTTDGKKPFTEKYDALINFKLAKYDILHNFKNNAEVLDEVDTIINRIRNNNNLTVESFKVTGYASPEGTPQYNMNLSKNRAESFVSYLRAEYGIPAERISTDWKGQDWDGLLAVVRNVDVPDKEEIITILENEPDPNARTRKLKQLSGGSTYHTLLQDYYPRLRRNEYAISYTSRPFTVEEARVLIKTTPQHLGPNEMCLVANTYKKNGREYKEVLDTAVKYYPTNEMILLNLANYELENGNSDRAIDLLMRINTPEAWNNLGIAYCRKGEHERGKQYFQRAARAGLKSASQNAEELSRSLVVNL